MNEMSQGWAPNRRIDWIDAVERLRQLSADGKSASQIAAAMQDQLPGVTRNAIIGKLSRLGVRSDKRPGAFLTEKKRNGQSIAPRTKSRPISLAPITDSHSGVGRPARLVHFGPRKSRWVDRATASAPQSSWIEIADLTDLICHYPKGDPHDLSTFRYCGAVAQCGPYCAHHASLVYEGAGHQQAKENERRWLSSPSPSP